MFAYCSYTASESGAKENAIDTPTITIIEDTTICFYYNLKTYKLTVKSRKADGKELEYFNVIGEGIHKYSEAVHIHCNFVEQYYSFKNYEVPANKGNLLHRKETNTNTFYGFPENDGEEIIIYAIFT